VAVTDTPNQPAVVSATATMKKCDAGTRARRFTYSVRQPTVSHTGTLFRWKHRVHYCTKDGKVVKWRLIFDEVYDRSPSVEEKELMSNSFKDALPGASARSFRRRHVQQCIPIIGWIGCYNGYPQSQLEVTGDGGKKATKVKND
jgi:hypothetical protein